jgi:DNA primase
LNGSLVVPLHGERGDEGAARQVVGAYGRKLLDNLRVGTPKHLYLPGPHRGVLNREGIEGEREVILCEALLDALTFWAAGYRNVTSCYGVHGMTDELLAALKTCGTQRILIAFDGDEAGDRGAEAVAKQLMSEGLECFRLRFPKGEDANSYALAVKPAAKSLSVVIRSAEWMGTGIRYIQALLGHAELSTTQIYTQVSIRKLKEIHTATHPAKLRTAAVSAPEINTAQNVAAPTAEDVLAVLAAEALEEDEADDEHEHG